MTDVKGVDHSSLTDPEAGLRYLFVICQLFRRALSPLMRLVLMRKMMQDMVGAVGPEDMLSGGVGRVVDAENSPRHSSRQQEACAVTSSAWFASHTFGCAGSVRI